MVPGETGRDKKRKMQEYEPVRPTHVLPKLVRMRRLTEDGLA